MTGTSCPEDFGPGPMFTELEAPAPSDVPVILQRRKNYNVHVRASYARRSRTRLIA